MTILAPRKQRRAEAKKDREPFEPFYMGRGEPIRGQSNKHKKVLKNDEIYKAKKESRQQEEAN